MRKSMQIYSICLSSKILLPDNPASRNSTTACMLGYLRRTTTGTGYADLGTGYADTQNRIRKFLEPDTQILSATI